MKHSSTTGPELNAPPDVMNAPIWPYVLSIAREKLRAGLKVEVQTNEQELKFKMGQNE